MKIKTVSALEARTRFGQILNDVQGGQSRIVVEKSGVPMVGIISAREFQQLIVEREVRFAVVDRIRRRRPSVSDREVQSDVRAALKHVRRRRRA
jgi:prevent-host-death family protein